MEERLTLREFEEAIQSEDYPVDGEVFRAAFGDYDLDLPAGEESVGDILERGSMNEEYADAQAVLLDIYNNVCSDAVGRRNYTDRGGIEGMSPPSNWS